MAAKANPARHAIGFKNPVLISVGEIGEIPPDDVDDAAWDRAMESLAKKEGREIQPLPFSDD